MGSEVVVRSVAGSAFRQDVTLGGHALLADEPASAGGEDAGPGPYDLLLAALGTCKAMTVGMYARRKQWPLERVTVRLRHDRVHAKDCAECEARAPSEGATSGAMVEVIDAALTFEGPLDDGQRARLLEIAGRCPVHRTLESEVKIATRLA